MKKLKPNGFNLYKNGKFQFVVLEGNSEEEAIKRIKEYVKSNNFDLSEFTYKRFVNHSSAQFETKNLSK